MQPYINKIELKTLGDLNFDAYDEVIDVRSPREYEEDHIPGAVNLPVLDNIQRARVGLMHKQKGPFSSHLLGAQIITRNVSTLLKKHFASKNKEFKPLIYCWRGGKRSGSIAEICRQIGWQTTVINGGYKSYRKLVARTLYQNHLPFEIILLGGHTGTGKTEILENLSKFGIQSLNLEKMAEHRGSVFGRTAKDQPSQKKFESKILSAIANLDPSKIVVVEAESNIIGRVSIPPALWEEMKVASKITLEAPLGVRVDLIMAKYQSSIPQGRELTTLINKLAPFHSKDIVARWNKYATQGELSRLAFELLFLHYDPRYSTGGSLRRIFMDDLSTDTLDQRTEQFVATLKEVLPTQ